MQTIRRQDALEFEFAAKAPVLTVVQGESFVIETEDAGIGEVRSEDAAAGLAHSPRRLSTPALGNPMGGPVFIEGAEPGDLLEVSIERIEVDSQGFTNWGPGRTPIGNDHRWPTLNEYTVRILEHRPGPSGTTRDGRAFLYGEPLWDLQPMIGCIGVAPEREVTTSSTGQTIAGGNLDMRDVKEGAKVYLNVYHPGALLYIGDVHASQADTEYYGTADETRSEVQVSCRVIKNKRIPFIQLVFPDRIIAVRTGASLDVMVHQAVEDMITWLVGRLRRRPRGGIHAHLREPRLPHQHLPVHVGPGRHRRGVADEVFAGEWIGGVTRTAHRHANGPDSVTRRSGWFATRRGLSGRF